MYSCLTEERARAVPRENADDGGRAGAQKSATHVQQSKTPERMHCATDELAALIRDATGALPDHRGFEQILVQLELRGVTIRQFIDDIRPRLPRLSRTRGCGFGFFYSQALQWGSWQQQLVDEPETLEQAQAKARGCTACDRTGRKLSGEYCSCATGRDLRLVERPRKNSVPAASSFSAVAGESPN
jgi:hypothetical protein